MNYKSIRELYSEGYSDLDISRFTGHSMLKVKEVIDKIREQTKIDSQRHLQATFMEQEVFALIKEEQKAKLTHPSYRNKDLDLKIELLSKFV